MRVALIVYALGVVVGLLRTDGRWPARVGLSLLWPLGPLAFAVTVAMLLAVSLVAFPMVGVIVVAGISLAWRTLLR